MAASLWRFDWHPDLRDLVLREAAALDAGDLIAPGLFVGSAPYEPGRAGHGVGGGEVLVLGRPDDLLVPDGVEQVHVQRGAFKVSGNPADLVALLPGRIRNAPRDCELQLFATPGPWLLVRQPAGPSHFEPPELPERTSTGLSSRLARSIVNLVARPGERVLDPVCGVGILLTEAARIGCRVQGGDTNAKACWSARRNFEAVGLQATISQRDALQPDGQEPADALVGDLPYGRRLAAQDLEPFLSVLPTRARRWALVAHTDLSAALDAAGHSARYVVRVPKPTFTRFIHVGGESLAGAR